MQIERDQVGEIDDAAVEAELAEEDAKAAAQMRKLGVDDATIGRIRGRPVEEMLPKPARLADVERELAQLRELRKERPREYWSDATQAREAELTAARDGLQAGKAASAETPKKPETDDDVIDAGDLPLPESLKAEWRKSPGGIEDALNAIRSRAGTIMSSLGDEDGEGLMRSFDDDLGEEEQAAIAAGLAEDAGRWPVATEVEIADFRSMEGYGEELLAEWGKQAPKLLGRARREAEGMLASMSPVARTRTERWVAGLSATRKAAVVRALAARPQRRL